MIGVTLKPSGMIGIVHHCSGMMVLSTIVVA